MIFIKTDLIFNLIVFAWLINLLKKNVLLSNFSFPSLSLTCLNISRIYSLSFLKIKPIIHKKEWKREPLICHHHKDEDDEEDDEEDDDDKKKVRHEVKIKNKGQMSSYAFNCFFLFLFFILFWSFWCWC